MSDQPNSPIEDRVRRALLDHTEKVEPRPDAYARLAERVNESGQRRWFASWLPSPRLALAATVATVAVAGGVVLANQNTGNGPAVLSDDVLSDDVVGQAGATDEGTDGSGGSTIDDGADDATGGIDSRAGSETGDAAEDAPIVGPVASTPRAAGQAFLDLVDIRFTELTEVDDTLVVRTLREGGDEVGPVVATLHVVEASASGTDGWAVSHVTSDDIVIDSPSAGEHLDSGSLTVSGEGTGFEATVDIEVRSASDGSVIADTFTTAGNFGELAPFDVPLELVNADRAWLVVASSSGADDGAPAFAAVPFSYDGRPDSTPYVVVTVDSDDPDGGLNVRALPGAGEEKVGVLSWGAAVTRSPDAAPRVIGESVWWKVEADDGTEGWVNAGFLAASLPVAAAELEPEVETFLAAGANPAAAPAVTASERLGVSVYVDGEMTVLPGGQLEDEIGWQDPAAGDASMVELVSAPDDLDDVSLVIDSFEFVDASLEDVALTYFGGLTFMTASYTGADGRPHHTHLFYSVTPNGPELVGVIPEIGEAG